MNRGVMLALAWTLAWAAGAVAENIDDLLARAQNDDAKALKALRMQMTESKDTVAGVERVVEGYRSAAVKGDTRAQFEFGFLLEQGIGIPRDYRQAEGWYRKAAEQGLVQAQYRLGRLYHEGKAVGADRRQAWVWLSLAATGGSQPAARLRERAAATLAPGDLQRAQAEAEAMAARIGAARPPA